MHNYIGVGPGAHGRFDEGQARVGTVAISDPRAWGTQVREKDHGRLSEETVSTADQATEMMLMGLRLSEGVSLSRYQELAGAPLDPQKLLSLTGTGLVSLAGDRLTVTATGRPLLNSVLKELLA